jgi:hypothetical protein
MRQGTIVYQSGNGFSATGAIDHCAIATGSDAAVAIKSALSALGPDGGDVALGPGDFPLNEPVVLPDNVWLHGAGRATRLRVTPENQRSIGLVAEGQRGIEISSLTVVGEGSAKAGIHLSGCGDCKVHDVTAARFAGYGIWIREHSFLCEVRGCTLAGNGKAGIFLENQRRGPWGDFIPNLITNCIVYGGGRGIDCLETTVLNIVACAAYQTHDTAFAIRDVSYSVLISASRTFQIGGNAVVVQNTGEVNLSSNVFCWHTGDGVVLRDVGWGTVCGNEIIDSGSYNPGAPDFSTPLAAVPPDVDLRNGLVLEDARGISVSGNTLFNWPQARQMRSGIVERGRCHHNAITGNSVNYFAEAGIVASGEGTLVANNVLEPNRPHDGNPHETQLQSFQPELLDRFIEGLAR